MTPTVFYTTILVPGIAWCQTVIPEVPWQRNARVLGLAIAGQESGWEYRVQLDGGEGHSFWMFETIGVDGVLSDPLVGPMARSLARAAGVAVTAQDIWETIATPRGDALAVGLMRLLLYSDPLPIPPPYAPISCYDYYDHLWRPGKPHEADWATNLAEANAAVPLTGEIA